MAGSTQCAAARCCILTGEMVHGCRTEGFQDFCLSFNRRPDVCTLIGERAEFVAYVNCVMDRISLDSTLDAAPGEHCVRARPDVGGERIPLNDRQFTDLITVHLADWLEQARPSLSVQQWWDGRRDCRHL
jgi:hypothetical protein